MDFVRIRANFNRNSCEIKTEFIQIHCGFPQILVVGSEELTEKTDESSTKTADFTQNVSEFLGEITQKTDGITQKTDGIIQKTDGFTKKTADFTQKASVFARTHPILVIEICTTQFVQEYIYYIFITTICSPAAATSNSSFTGIDTCLTTPC